MIGRIFAALLIASAGGIGMADRAEAEIGCGGDYIVKRGDSLSRIAERHYRDAGLWTRLHSENRAAIGPDADALLVGTRLRLPCPQERTAARASEAPQVTRAAPFDLRLIAPVASQTPGRISLLTGDGLAPFADRSAPGGGLVTELVVAALDHAAPERGHAVHWVNDRGAHLDPLLSNALLDMGFPWPKPDCAADPALFACANFHYSAPLFEMLEVLVTPAGRPLRLGADAGAEGHVLCRPQGLATHDLEEGGRNWLSQGRVSLRRAKTVAACFDLLLAGEVAAVAVNEFTARAAIAEMELEDRVTVDTDRPLAVETLHVVVHKTHPEAQRLLALVDGGIRAIRSDGRFQGIVDRHLSQIWAGL